MGDWGDDDLEALLEAELDRTDSASSGPASETRSPPRKRAHLRVQEESEPPVPSPSAAQLCPPHPGFIGGLCIRCGTLRSDEDVAQPSVAMRYVHEGLELSVDEAERLRRSTAAQVVAHRRLVLVLDLDHTLLNSTRYIDLTQEEGSRLEGMLKKDTEADGMEPAQDTSTDNNESLPADLVSLPALQTWTKLRPGVCFFLEQAHQDFELHVYTMGDKLYARAMAQILDPEGRLFSGRIISAGDSTERTVKDLDIVLGNPEQTLILDDTEAVWPRHGRNVLPIARYIFFRSCAKRFVTGPSWLERGSDEAYEEGPFPAILAVLREIHDSFFQKGSNEKGDARVPLAAARSRLLAGVHILFSRVVPLDSRNPARHPLWQLAELCGATCTLQPDSRVTHVVAPDWTQKVFWGREHKKHLVLPAWITETAGHWRRLPEEDFEIQASSARSGKPATVRTEQDDLNAVFQAAGGGGQN